MESWDTAFKLLILTNVIIKEEKKLSYIKIRGITNLTPDDIKIALKEEKRYKLIGQTSRSGKELSMIVRLEKLGKEDPFYNVYGKNKAVRYTRGIVIDWGSVMYYSSSLYLKRYNIY